MSRHFGSFYKQQHAPHRPELLNHEQYAVLAEKIDNTIRDTGHPSLTNVITFIRETFQIDASRPTAAKILDRIVFKLMARPIMEDRYTCSLDDIISYYTKLAELLTKIPCGFCFNLDESGIQQFVDGKDTYLIVPKTYPDHELTFPLYRAGKRITLLHCISTDATYIKPLFVIPRKTFDDDIFDYTNSNSCCFCSQENSFLFLSFSNTFFLSNAFPFPNNLSFPIILSHSPTHLFSSLLFRSNIFLSLSFSMILSLSF